MYQEMEKWLQSVYSDGTEQFVSSPVPSLGEEITIKIRMEENTPVQYVYLRTVPNGAERLLLMEKSFCEKGLCYYHVRVRVNEKVFRYQFYLVTADTIYYYTQAQITTYVPDHTYDFKLLAEYPMPKWVEGAIFYQIFPDRFCNGTAENDVKNGEYFFDGFPTIRREDWDGIPFSYEEGHCLDFFGGDLQGIKQKLPYLKELGVTALYLNPIFHAATNHRYDCLDYFTVDPHLGGNEALAELSAEVHRQGMYLILDVSVNHTGTAHKWFNKEGNFFEKETGAWGNPQSEEREYYFFNEDNSYKAWFDVETLPVLNYTSKKLCEIVYEGEKSLVKYWLRSPYEIDGWRFDVADVMARNDELQLQHKVWTGIHDSIKAENPHAYILAEDWGDCSEYLQGTEWDSPMNYYGFGRPVRQFCGEPDLFLARDEILKSIPYRMTARDLKSRIMEHLAKLPHVIQAVQFNLFDSHDVARLHNNPEIKQGDYEGAVIMLFSMPGASNIYYGDETGIGGGRNDALEFRYPMPWREGMTQTKPYILYQTLAKKKQESIALRKGSFRIIYAEGQIFSYVRFWKDESVVVVWSTEDNVCEAVLPLSVLGEFQVNVKEDVFGRTLKYEMKGMDMHLKMPAHTAYMFWVRK